MSAWCHELRHVLRAPVAVWSLVLLAALTIASLVSGMVFVDAQRRAIDAIPALQAEDAAAVRATHGDSTDAGTAAYYSFQPTWNPPSALAFAAIGMRDIAPQVLRVRALGLEAQIHDGDVYNPELALAGRFDFAFVLVFLAPLFLIVLLHDLRSGEREAGREGLLAAFAGPSAQLLFVRRASLRFALVLASLSFPFSVAAATSGVSPVIAAAVIAIAAVYLAFWTLVAVGVSRLRWRSSANAAALATVWACLALVLPAVANFAINRAVPVLQGAEIAQRQREAVNRAWDIPRADTMATFYARYPEWADAPPLPEGFHYRWYLAFHQNGDDGVAELSRDYREGIESRIRIADRLAMVLPPVAVQILLERLAETDLRAHLAYQDRVRAYHGALRRFYYGYLFRDRPYTGDDFDRAPKFEPDDR